MKNKISTMVMLGVLTLALTGSGFAQMHGVGHGDKCMQGKHMPLLSHAEELGLSEKQVADLKNIHHEFLKKSIEAESKLKILELDFKKSMMDDASAKKLNKQVDNIAAQSASKRKLHISTHFKVKNTLTDEQWIDWKKSMRGGKKGKMKRMEIDREHSMRKEM